MTSNPAPRRPPLVPGILLAIFGLILIMIGGAVTLVSSVGEALLASPETEVTKTLEVQELAPGDYALYLTDEIGEPLISDPVSSVTCDVVNGGATQTIATSPLISVESSNMQLIGTFTGVAGAASITCAWQDGHASTGYTFVMTPSKGVPVPAVILFIAGGVLFVGGALLILRAALARRRPVA